MFTGIVQAIGTVHSLANTEEGTRIVIDPAGWGHQPAAGDSIANNGCCLTLVSDEGGLWSFDAIPETIEKTTLGMWKAGDRVNLERSLRVGDGLDGHQVQGHVDGTGKVIGVEDGSKDGDGYRVRITLGGDLMRWMIPKGSVAIDGISLTIADLDAGECWIEVALIPETLDRTTLGAKVVGDVVNIEGDAMVKTIVHTLGQMDIQGRLA